MTDLSHIAALARGLELSEPLVDTPGVVDSLRELRARIDAADVDDPQVAKWLSGEHFAGGVISTAATMNKRAELTGKGAQFNRISRYDIIAKYNRWVKQLLGRLEAYERGYADVPAWLQQLEHFRADPVRNDP